MPKIPNFLSPRVLQLMQRIEVEKDRETLVQLFSELNVLLNEDEQTAQPCKKPPRSNGFYRKRGHKGSK